MSLRDSAQQLMPYARFAGEDPLLGRMIQGLAARHLHCLAIDAYANSFTYLPVAHAAHSDDLTTMKAGVFERKYTPASAVASIALVHEYWFRTGDAGILDSSWEHTMQQILEIWRLEQDHGNESGYRFQRPHGEELDTLANQGAGTPVNFTRLTWSGFRPDNTRCEFHFNIPSQAAVAVALKQLEALAVAVANAALLDEAEALGADIRAGIAEHAISSNPKTGETVLGYEIDGYGNAVIADVAGLPGLLALPHLGYCSCDDPLYLRSREFVLSTANPYFVSGRIAEGLRDSTMHAERVSPSSVIMRALTSHATGETHHCLGQLLRLLDGSVSIPAWIDADAPQTRSHICLMRDLALFAELIFSLAEHQPAVLVDFQTGSR